MKTQLWNVKLHYNVLYISCIKICIKRFFSKNIFDKLYPSSSALARSYVATKMHKYLSWYSFPNFRPIVSSIGTFNYNLVRFLCDLLSPLVPTYYSCKDTFSLVPQIKNANRSGKFLVSYDVTSLLANISIQETIDLAINFIFNHNPNLNNTKKEI